MIRSCYLVKGQCKFILVVKSRSKYLAGQRFDRGRRSEYRIYRSVTPLYFIFYSLLLITRQTAQHSAYVASRSMMFGRNCLLPNIDALCINSPVPPCDCRRICIATTPLLAYVSFYKIYLRRGVFNAYLLA